MTKEEMIDLLRSVLTKGRLICTDDTYDCKRYAWGLDQIDFREFREKMIESGLWKQEEEKDFGLSYQWQYWEKD
jgi:hypothetical protein